MTAIYIRRLEVADAEELLEVLVRDRAFLDQWEPTRPDGFYTLGMHKKRLKMLRGDENFADFGIFLAAGDELVGRIQLVQAAVMPRNGASVRVLEKAGFREEGFAPRYLQIAGSWEDHKLFAVTAEEWPIGA